MIEVLLWLPLNAALVVLSFYLNSFAHELGHLLVGNLAGIKIRKIVIARASRPGLITKPSFSLFSVAFYTGASSLGSCVLIDIRALKRATPKKRIVMLAGGPILGSIASVAWSVTLFLSLHSHFQAVLSALWLYMQVGTLLKGKSDGDSIREALQELKAS